MFHKILVALDSSERASGVFDVAIDLARTAGARLYPTRVITVPPEFPAAAAGAPADPLLAHMAATAMQDMSRLLAGAPDDVAVRPPIVRVGVPWKIVLEISEERDVDLIVIGSHGFHGWDHILGTTAAKIVNNARRHVLVVHSAPGAASVQGASSSGSGESARDAR